VDEVVVVAGRGVHKRKAGEGAEGQKCEIEQLGSISGAPSEMGVEIGGWT
jgi:hypothetical protein